MLDILIMLENRTDCTVHFTFNVAASLTFSHKRLSEFVFFIAFNQTLTSHMFEVRHTESLYPVKSSFLTTSF